MKLVQLIRPLFITAIGLHAALLFVPIGPDEPVVVEDVELSELASGDVTKTEKTSPAGLDPLPVPDPNVTTGATAATAAKTSPQQAATGRTAATRTATRATRATNSSTATASRGGNASNASSSNTSAANGGSAASNSRNNNSRNTASSSSTSNGSASSNSASSNTERQTFIASSGEQSSEQSSTTEQNASGNTSDASTSNQSPGNQSSGTQTVDVESPLTVETLLAKVTQELPKDFRDFVSDLHQSLTYSEKLTDNDSVAAAKADWRANIQAQANVGQIEQMPTADISELTKIDYPIESSLKSEGLTISRCLTPAPESAEIGVLFDSRGDIVGEPELIRSTGYSALNDEIKATVVAYEDFPGDRSSKAYTFEVEVDYDADACVSLTDLKGEKP